MICAGCSKKVNITEAVGFLDKTDQVQYYHSECLAEFVVKHGGIKSFTSLNVAELATKALASAAHTYDDSPKNEVVKPTAGVKVKF